MKDLFKKSILEEKASTDSILVALLLVIIGVAAILSLNIYVDNEKEAIQLSTVAQIEKMLEENAPAATDDENINSIEVKDIEVNDVDIEELKLHLED